MLKRLICIQEPTRGAEKSYDGIGAKFTYLLENLHKQQRIRILQLPKLGQTDGIVITFTFNDVDAYRGRNRVATQTMKFFVTEKVLDAKLDKVIETALVDLK